MEFNQNPSQIEMIFIFFFGYIYSAHTWRDIKNWYEAYNILS